MKRSRLVTIVATAVVVFLQRDARGSTPTKEQCVNFNEHGQTLRDQHQLRAAREQFVACGNQSCPGAVREDCVDQLQKLDHALPSVLISVRSRAGDDLRTVTVRVDGEVMAERVDGTPLTVDPGEHEFSFEAAGYVKKTTSVRTREGVHDQRIAISLDPNPVTATDSRPDHTSSIATSSASPTRPTPQTESAADSPAPRRVLAYALVGAGAVALGLSAAFGVSAKVRYDDATGPDRCPGGPPICDARGVDGVHGAYSAAAVATVSFVVASALAGAGILLWLTTPLANSAGATSSRGMVWKW